jgi:anti-anti-sigma factor
VTGEADVKSQQYEGQGQGVAVLSMGGDLDLSRTEEVGRAIQRAESLEPGVLVLDLRRVTFIDSTMLREIVAAHLGARREGRRIAVAAVSEAVRRVFRITLLEWRVEIVDDPADVGASGPGEPG